MSDSGPTADHLAIQRIILRINESWLTKRYEEIGSYLTEDVIIAPPGSENRIHGREAYVQSYRDYDQAAKTHKFTPSEPRIDIIGNVAVAVCPFLIVYEMQQKMFRENGNDLLVFARTAGEWRIAWRSMQTEPALDTTTH
jgi:hypothetical protein